jgi:hypothetical protein
MDHKDDEEVGEEAEAQAEALGWPGHYCLDCIRKFASRQDGIYKMMGLKALTQIAWKDPEAMTILIEITKNTRSGANAMVRSVSSGLVHADCGNQSDMDAWNARALPFLGRIQSALASANWHLRPLAAILLNCPRLRDDLKQSLQDYLRRVPEPSLHGTPMPETRIY